MSFHIRGRPPGPMLIAYPRLLGPSCLADAAAHRRRGAATAKDIADITPLRGGVDTRFAILVAVSS